MKTQDKDGNRVHNYGFVVVAIPPYIEPEHDIKIAMVLEKMRSRSV